MLLLCARLSFYGSILTEEWKNGAIGEKSESV